MPPAQRSAPVQESPRPSRRAGLFQSFDSGARWPRSRRSLLKQEPCRQVPPSEILAKRDVRSCSLSARYRGPAGETVPFFTGLVPRDDRAAGSPCAAAFPEDAPVRLATDPIGPDRVGGSSSDSQLSTSHLTPLSRSQVEDGRGRARHARNLR